MAVSLTYLNVPFKDKNAAKALFTKAGEVQYGRRPECKNLSLTALQLIFTRLIRNIWQPEINYMVVAVVQIFKDLRY